FRLLAERLKDEVIVTSAGNCSELWWEITGESERVFYLEASMSLASLFAAGIALGAPQRTVVAFSGDGAFSMNPGMLLVERQLALPNLKHFLVSNGVYGSTNDLAHPFRELVDYAGMAQAAGIERIYAFSTLEGLAQGLDDMIRVPGHAFAVLDVEPLGRHPPSPPLDGPEVKFRFGRYLERTGGRQVFDPPLKQRQRVRAQCSIQRDSSRSPRHATRSAQRRSTRPCSACVSLRMTHLPSCSTLPERRCASRRCRAFRRSSTPCSAGRSQIFGAPLRRCAARASPSSVTAFWSRMPTVYGKHPRARGSRGSRIPTATSSR